MSFRVYVAVKFRVYTPSKVTRANAPALASNPNGCMILRPPNINRNAECFQARACTRRKCSSELFNAHATFIPLQAARHAANQSVLESYALRRVKARLRYLKMKYLSAEITNSNPFHHHYKWSSHALALSTIIFRPHRALTR